MIALPPVQVVPRVHQAPEGGYLVGLAVAKAQRQKQIAGIFQRGREYFSEPLSLPPGTPQKTFLARAGYAVGGLRAVVHDQDQFAVIFMRVQPDGFLDPTDQYTEILGDVDGFSPRQRSQHFQTLLSDGRPVVGIRYNRTITPFYDLPEGYRLLMAAQREVPTAR